MTSRPVVVRTARLGIPRALACLALGAALAGTSGCGLSVLGHRADVTEAPLVPAAAHVPDDLAGTRARMAEERAEPFWAYRLGVLYAQADSTREAEAALRKALALDPAHAPSLALLSDLWFKAGRHDEAIRMLEDARAHAFPDGMPAALLEGLALHYDAVDRVADARAALAAAPASDAGRSARAYLELRGEAAGDADVRVEDAAKHAPKSAVNQNNLGIARLRAGDPDGAEKAFTKAIHLDASLPGPYYNLAILAKFYRFDDAAAARWFRAYRERASTDPDGLASVIGGEEAHPIAERKE